MKNTDIIIEIPSEEKYQNQKKNVNTDINALKVTSKKKHFVVETKVPEKPYTCS